MNPLLMVDGYKTSHHIMYPKGTNLVYSNFTPRSVKYMHDKAKDIIVFGTQYTMKYIHDLYDENFFKRDKNEVINEAKVFLSSYLNSDYDTTHFEKLHDLGYLPLKVKSLEEGTLINEKIPLFVIYNTNDEFYWLPNFLETLISSLLWKPLHSASISYAYKKLLIEYGKKTDEKNLNTINFALHDFSFRGMQHAESAITSSMGFLVNSFGTDTIPALQAIKYYYNSENVGFSVPASEHSVATAYGKENEFESFSNIISLYPKDILSLVSDSFDLWQVCTNFLPRLKETIMNRDGKIVIRPDSGNPVDIVCGNLLNYKDISKYFPEGEILPKYFEDVLIDEVREDTPHGECGVSEYEQFYIVRGKLIKAKIHNISWNRHDKQYYYIDMYEKANITIEEIDILPSDKGVVELLWDVFGGTINDQGYKVLDSHIGVIYGDSITLDIAEQMCEKLVKKGFATTNIVYGVGSYSLGYSSRDSQGCAIKATYVEINNKGQEIFKEPKTDNGMKKSAKGLLKVFKNEEDKIILKDQCTWKEENEGLLEEIYLNGKFIKVITFNEIRENVNKLFR